MFYLPDGDQSPIAHVIEAMAQFQAGEELVADATTVPGTVESVKRWLNSLAMEDSSQLVPPSLGQQKAWDVVKTIPGCPTQNLVRKAQAERKSEAAGTD